jgi:hypothetical protein
MEVNMRCKTKLVFGVGINDVEYTVTKSNKITQMDGRQKLVQTHRCPYYVKWREMLRRCYCIKNQVKQPTYIGCAVDHSWLYLSNFIKWVDSQPNKNWRNSQLDKDLLIEGNKHYSPDTCVFIGKSLNAFILDRRGARGKFLIGVNYYKLTSKFMAQCSDPFKNKSSHVGYFNTELEAHLAWQAKKHEYACQLAELQEDLRLANVLRTKYAPDKDWTNK